MRPNFSKYARLAAPGVVDHAFINASDAPGQYEAELCNRQAVTASWLFDHPDVTGYIYHAEAADVGLDPWVTIEGVDLRVDKLKAILWHGRTGEKEVEPDYVVYAPRRAVEQEVASG